MHHVPASPPHQATAETGARHPSMVTLGRIGAFINSEPSSHEWYIELAEASWELYQLPPSLAQQQQWDPSTHPAHPPQHRKTTSPGPTCRTTVSELTTKQC